MNNGVTKEQIEQARKLDLLSYLETYQPDELVKISGNVYSMKSHDSLKMSNGRWFRWAQGVGGVSALDYFVKVENMDFVSAVKMLCDKTAFIQPQHEYLRSPKPKQPLTLPERNSDNKRATEYLAARGIYPGIIRWCISTGRLYEDTKHNCVFVGFKPDGEPGYATMRSSDPRSTIHIDAPGSDKRCSFFIPGKGRWHLLRVFESAIDLLSFMTLEIMADEITESCGYLSLSGIYQPKDEVMLTPLPAALAQKLHEFPQITDVVLCLDNDEVGRRAAKTLEQLLSAAGLKTASEPPFAKDYNEQLMKQKGLGGIAVRGAKADISLSR